MAISGGWVGSSAVNETGERWMSAARSVVRLPAAGWMSEMVGRSKEITINQGADHNFNPQGLINLMASYGNTPIVLNIVGDLVAVNAATSCLYFPSGLQNEYIKLNITATIYGRGGNGGSNGGGGNGGNCITNEIGGRLQIFNYGAICGGGGGGGGGSWNTGITTVICGGGGGRPFGAAGATANTDNQASAGSLTAPGTGSRNGNAINGGTGGDVGGAGAACYGNSGNRYGGGAAGAAVNGNAPSWQVVGNIYGSRV